MSKGGAAFAALITGKRPEYASSKSYLYRKDPKLFLRGFALDMPPGGCYVWKYMFPLFSSLEFVSLTFGYRLEGGYVETAGVPRAQVLDAILTIIDGNSDFAEEESAAEFVSFLQDSRISAPDRREGMALVELCSGIDPARLEKRVEANKARYGLAAPHRAAPA